MTYSEIAICNIALALVGEKSIRSFDENNKRARLSKPLYEITRDMLLTRIDWSFARKMRELKQIDTTNLPFDVPEGWYVYARPSDCLALRRAEPLDISVKWRSVQGYVISPVTPLSMWYTKSITTTNLFSAGFVDSLSLGLAARLAGPLTQSKQLALTLRNEFLASLPSTEEEDANQNGDYPEEDNNPYVDSFVNPDSANAYLNGVLSDADS